MQDYNYVHGSCMEITLEISCCKYPTRQNLPSYWEANRQALLAYLHEVHRGVRGIITDTNGSPVPEATLKIKGRETTFKPSKRGEFWRILLPGTYVLEVSAPGYKTSEQTFTVSKDHITYINVELSTYYGPQQV